MIIWVLLLIIVMSTVIYVGLPLFEERHWKYIDQYRLSAIYEEKKTGLWALSDIKNEYEMGKLTEEEYRELSNHFKKLLLPIIKSQSKEGMGIKAVATESPDKMRLRRDALNEVIKIWSKKVSSR
ncbi:MAG: hypothetical protein D6726_08305 [Nitrospirae bacterium]|nr:MAG: hypothetical protein D6726_08305 [Nitrospirota bacterium]